MWLHTGHTCELTKHNILASVVIWWNLVQKKVVRTGRTYRPDRPLRFRINNLIISWLKIFSPCKDDPQEPTDDFRHFPNLTMTMQEHDYDHLRSFRFKVWVYWFSWSVGWLGGVVDNILCFWKLYFSDSKSALFRFEDLGFLVFVECGVARRGGGQHSLFLETVFIIF